MQQGAPINPGEVLAGKYRVDKVLGAGAMGVVVAGTDLALDRKVAIKMMKPRGSVQREKEERFLREARVVAKLRSEHVVNVLDFGTVGEAPFIVMEYLEGCDLAALLEERGVLPIGEAVTLTLQACDAIAEAHAAGVVHRDIKPANLFVTTGTDGMPKIKVVDFGIAKDDKSVMSLTGTADVLGSPLYMSPEAIRGTRDVDARTDVWALACCLFEMLAGVSPFMQDTLAHLIVAIGSMPPLSLARYRQDVPPGLSKAIEHALEKDRELRTPSVAAFAAEIAPYAPPLVASYAGIAAGARSAGVGSVAVPPAPPGDPSVQPVLPSARPAEPVTPPPSKTAPAVTSLPEATRMEASSGPATSAASTTERRASRATAALIVLATVITAAVVVSLVRDRAAPTTVPPSLPAISGTVPVAEVVVPLATADPPPIVAASGSPTGTTTATASAPQWPAKRSPVVPVAPAAPVLPVVPNVGTRRPGSDYETSRK
jgi:serine/threonine-protein kinase